LFLFFTFIHFWSRPILAFHISVVEHLRPYLVVDAVQIISID